MSVECPKSLAAAGKLALRSPSQPQNVIYMCSMDKKRETPKKKKSPWDSQEVAANTEWTQKASRPVDVHEDKKRETPEKKTSPWDSQEFLGDQGSAPKKTRRSSPWSTEEPSTKEELAPKATSRPGPWGTEQAVCKSPKPPCATARRRGPWD